jgi:cyanate permease
MSSLRSHGWQTALRIVAAIAAISAITLVYEGFQGAFGSREFLWAAPVVLAVAALALMLWEEERSAAQAELMRAARDREKLSSVRDQQPHGTTPDDSTI